MLRWVARNRMNEWFSRVLPSAVARAVAVDPLLQNSRRLEHHHAARGNRRPGGLRMTADAPAFFGIFLQGSVSLPCQNPRSFSRCASRPGNATLVHASVYKNAVIQGAAIRALRASVPGICGKQPLTLTSPREERGEGEAIDRPPPPQRELIPLWFGVAASAAAGALAGADASVYLGSLSARISILWMAGGLASSSPAFAISAAATLPLR